MEGKKHMIIPIDGGQGERGEEQEDEEEEEEKRGASFEIFGLRLKSRFFESDFHMAELCNQTNICGSPPALQSPSWEPVKECYYIPVFPPAPITLQFTLALWNSTFPKGTCGVD